MSVFTDLFAFVVERHEQILSLLLQHIQLTALAVTIAIMVGVPVGVLISRYRQLNKPIIGFTNVVQSIPSMAALGFLIPFLGIGNVPAIFMVVLYALLPIVKNTFTGMSNINKETIEAARGIGMTDMQILFRVQFPMALPVIMAGVRISAVNSVGLMTLASLIGAGGLGYMIYSGVQLVNTSMILSGAIPSCILALLIDFLFSKVEKAVTPIPLRAGMVLPESAEKLEKLRKDRKRFLALFMAGLLLLGGFMAYNSIEKEGKVVSVTSKNYPEQLLLGNLAADLIEGTTDITVDRRLNMGGTQVCHSALATGEIDVQVEYTSSMFMAVLGQEVCYDADYILETTRQMYDDEYNLKVLGSYGFNNTYGIAVRRAFAEENNLSTISDLAKIANKVTISPTFEFNERDDGIKGLTAAYNMSFKDVIPVESGLRYVSIDEGNCDAIVAYTTDALIHSYDLVMLEDDLNFFMPYYAVPVVRGEILEEYPEIEAALNILENELTNEIMSELNYQIEVEGLAPEVVSKNFLQEHGYID